MLVDPSTQVTIGERASQALVTPGWPRIAMHEVLARPTLALFDTLTAVMRLVRPAREHLQSYVAALQRGWSPDSQRGDERAREELVSIRFDADLFLEGQVDREAKGAPVVLPDGSTAPRLPGYRYWLWDGEFCGIIGFRWQPGTTELPPYYLGHIGYSVVPWKRGLGYATAALRQLLPIASREGLPFVEITTDPTNLASRRVIAANGGVLIEQFTKGAEHGGSAALRYRIEFTVPNLHPK